MQTHLERLRVQISECELIRDLATDPVKRATFDKLAAHFRVLAGELENAIAKCRLRYRTRLKATKTESCRPPQFAAFFYHDVSSSRVLPCDVLSSC